MATTPDETTGEFVPEHDLDDDDAAFDELAQRAGAALRRPATDARLNQIVRQGKQRRTTTVIVAGGAALALVVAGVVLLGGDDERDTISPIVDTVPESSPPDTPVETTAPTSDPTATSVVAPAATTVVEQTTITSPEPASPTVVATPGVSVPVTVGSMMYSSDGSRLYAPTSDGDSGPLALRIYDAVSLQVIGELECPITDDFDSYTAPLWNQQVAATWHAEKLAGGGGRYPSFAVGNCDATFSPDGTRAMAGYLDATTAKPLTVLWDAVSGTEVATLDGRGLTFTPDSTRIIGQQMTQNAPLGPSTMRVWDAQTGALIFESDDDLGAIVFSGDGSRFMTTTHGALSGEPIVLWDTSSFTKLATAPATLGPQGLSLNSDGTRFATADGLFDALTGEQLVRYDREQLKNAQSSVAEFWVDDSVVVTSGGNTGVRVYDVATGDELVVLEFDPAFAEQEPRDLSPPYPAYQATSFALSPDDLSLMIATVTCGIPPGTCDDGPVEFQIQRWTLSTG